MAKARVARLGARTNAGAAVVAALNTGASVSVAEVVQKHRRVAGVSIAAVRREIDALILDGYVRDIGLGRYRLVAKGGRPLLGTA